MVHYKYTDKQGREVLTCSTSVPDIMFVPPGFKREDAVFITADEVQKKVDDTKQKEKAYKPRDLLAEIDALKSDLAQVKADKQPKP